MCTTSTATINRASRSRFGEGDRAQADRILRPAFFIPWITWKPRSPKVSIRWMHFLCHMWAVTIIGAPKNEAAQAIEIWRKRPRLVRRRGRNDLDGRRYQHRDHRFARFICAMAWRRNSAGRAALHSDPASEDRECA